MAAATSAYAAPATAREKRETFEAVLKYTAKTKRRCLRYKRICGARDCTRASCQCGTKSSKLTLQRPKILSKNVLLSNFAHIA